MHKLLLVLLFPAMAMAQATTQPASLLNGKLHYAPPSDWVSQGLRSDGRSAGYKHDADPAGLIVITVTPQSGDIPANLGNALYQQLSAAIKKEAASGNIESVSPPKRISDSRFMLRLHDQFKSKGEFADRDIVYRAVGRDLVSVVSTTFSQAVDQQAKVDKAGQELALSASLGMPSSRPTTR